MHLLKLAIVLIALMPSAAHAHGDCPAAKCEETKQKIKLIESRMRQGYTRAQGERMQEQLRRLRAIRAKRCR